MDRRPRTRRMGDRPDDRRVRRPRRRARRGLPSDRRPMRLLRGDGPLIRVGHRGAAALAPENTLRSFEAALAHGVDAIEFDVLDLAGGPLVLAHSNDLAEVSHGAAAGHRARPLARRAARARAASCRRSTRRSPCSPTRGRGRARRPEAPDAGSTSSSTRSSGTASAARTVVSSFHLPSLRAVARRRRRSAIGFTYPEDRYGVVAAARAAAGDPARHARAAARVVARVPGDDRARRRGGADAAPRGRLAARRSSGRTPPARPSGPGRSTIRREVERLEAAGVDAVITNDPGSFRGRGYTAAVRRRSLAVALLSLACGAAGLLSARAPRRHRRAGDRTTTGTTTGRRRPRRRRPTDDHDDDRRPPPPPRRPPPTADDDPRRRHGRAPVLVGGLSPARRRGGARRSSRRPLTLLVGKRRCSVTPKQLGASRLRRRRDQARAPRRARRATSRSRWRRRGRVERYVRTLAKRFDRAPVDSRAAAARLEARS